MPEAEYLIRPASHDGWLAIPATAVSEVLTPQGYDVQPGPGFGDFHLQTADYEVSFAAEDPGWQVSFRGVLADLDTDEMVAQIARQIQDFTRTPTEWTRYV